MTCLLDTCTFLWIEHNRPAMIGRKAMAHLGAPGGTFLLSQASIWELAIKLSIGKLALTAPLESVIRRHMANSDFRILDVTLAHSFRLTALPLHNRDPFDRLIASQALSEGLPILSADAIFDDSGVQRVWD